MHLCDDIILIFIENLQPIAFQDGNKQSYNKQVLKRSARSQRNRYRVYDVYRASPQDCTACPLQAKWLSKLDATRCPLSMEVGSQQPNLIEQMKAKINDPQGKELYARRPAIVKPVFANIHVHKRLDRFTLRSRTKGRCAMEIVCSDP